MMTPEQEDAEDLRELLRDVSDRAISRWKEAVKERDEAFRLASHLAALEPWTGLTTIQVMNAGRLLIHVILAYDPDYRGIRRNRAEKRRWPARGIRCHGKLYIAVPNEDRDEGKEGIPEDLDGPDLMQLIVVEESRIVDIEREGYLPA